MSHAEDLVRIYTGSTVEITYIVERMKENGISCLVKNDFQSSINAGFVDSTPDVIDIYVAKKNRDKAICFIQSLLKND